jgi:hypothetical protein
MVLPLSLRRFLQQFSQQAMWRKSSSRALIPLLTGRRWSNSARCCQARRQPMQPKTFKNAEEFTRYIANLTGKPFKAMASTDGTTACKYLIGRRDYANLFTDSDLIAIVDDKHPDGGLLYVFSDYSSVVYKPAPTN